MTDRGYQHACIRCFTLSRYTSADADGNTPSRRWFNEQRRGLCDPCTSTELAERNGQFVLGADDLETLVDPTPAQRFEEFHLANPDVYKGLVRYTKEAVDHGLNKLSIWDAANRLRWHMKVETNDPHHRLNNNHLAFFARLIMAQEKGLRGVFNTRAMKTQSDKEEEAA